MKGWAFLFLPILKSGLEVLGVEELGAEAVAEGAGVARPCAAAWGGKAFLPGTNRERIGCGQKGRGLPWVVWGGSAEHIVQLWGIAPGVVKGAAGTARASQLQSSWRQVNG